VRFEGLKELRRPFWGLSIYFLWSVMQRQLYYRRVIHIGAGWVFTVGTARQGIIISLKLLHLDQHVPKSSQAIRPLAKPRPYRLSGPSVPVVPISSLRLKQLPVQERYLQVRLNNPAIVGWLRKAHNRDEEPQAKEEHPLYFKGPQTLPEGTSMSYPESIRQPGPHQRAHLHGHRRLRVQPRGRRRPVPGTAWLPGLQSQSKLGFPGSTNN
jgi:hypothetical protein